MKCPFRIIETTSMDYKTDRVEKTKDFGSCYGDECPFYYQDEDGVSKCSRCNPITEEEI